jgi:hypothetical protein
VGVESVNLEPIKNRVENLSAAFPAAEDELLQRKERFLARLNVDELKRLRDIKRRYEAGLHAAFLRPQQRAVKGNALRVARGNRTLPQAGLSQD